jgi:hypothetical protein
MSTNLTTKTHDTVRIYEEDEVVARDFFAGLVMLGIILKNEGRFDSIAETAYSMADAMLRARIAPPKEP